jgi:hypothetical protein
MSLVSLEETLNHENTSTLFNSTQAGVSCTVSIFVWFLAIPTCRLPGAVA